MKSLSLPLVPEEEDGQQTQGYVESLGPVYLFCPLSCWPDVLCYLFISIYLSIHHLISLSYFSSTYYPSSSYLSSIYLSIYLSSLYLSSIYLFIHPFFHPTCPAIYLSYVSVIYLYLSMSTPISLYLSIALYLCLIYLSVEIHHISKWPHGHKHEIRIATAFPRECAAFPSGSDQSPSAGKAAKL